MGRDEHLGLVGSAVLGLDGIDRILSTSELQVIGPISAHTVGTLLAASAVALIAAAYFFRARTADMRPIVLVLSAAAMAFFTLNTATPTYHFVLPLALVIASRAALPRWAYIGAVTALSVTSLVSMYAMGAYWLTQHPTWSLGLYSPENPVSAFVATLPGEDWVLSGLALTNLLVMTLLAVFSLLASPKRTYRVELAHTVVSGADTFAAADRESGFEGARV